MFEDETQWTEQLVREEVLAVVEWMLEKAEKEPHPGYTVGVALFLAELVAG